MNNPKILVTAASGRTGSAVVNQLLEAGRPVRAVVRSRDSRSERLSRLGAEVVVADLFDASQLAEAMRGTSSAYYCPPFHPQMMHSAAAFLVAAREAKLESFVSLSQWLADPSHPSPATRQHWLVDRLFEASGIPHTTLNPGFFADNYFRVLAYAAQLGVFPMPLDGASRNAPPSNEDIARVAVAALLDPAKHAGKTYRPTGPRLLSVDEIVAIIGRALGREVRRVNLPMWMFLKAAMLDRTDAMLVASLPSYLAEHSAGTFEIGAPSGHVLEVTGREAEHFETIAARYAALPQARRTIANGARALAAFASVPFRTGFDIAGFERRHEFPTVEQARLSAFSATWRAEHGSARLDGRAIQNGPVGAFDASALAHLAQTR